MVMGVRILYVKKEGIMRIFGHIVDDRLASNPFIVAMQKAHRLDVHPQVIADSGAEVMSYVFKKSVNELQMDFVEFIDLPFVDRDILERTLSEIKRVRGRQILVTCLLFGVVIVGWLSLLGILWSGLSDPAMLYGDLMRFLAIYLIAAPIVTILCAPYKAGKPDQMCELAIVLLDGYLSGDEDVMKMIERQRSYKKQKPAYSITGDCIGDFLKESFLGRIFKF